MKKTKPQLTISLLISNRLDTIPKCLDSLKPIMDTIPCELILTDTSKNPEVHNLLLQYTDQIYEFDWCNDFAKARNLGLEKANGEWFLYLDDDEWFVDTEPLIDFFTSGEYKRYAYANYIQRNFKDAEYVYYHDDWALRMMRIDEDTCFVNKIHEHLNPIRGIGKNINTKAYHSGYIYKTQEDRRRHFERNYKLILDMIKEEPDRIYWYMQLTQEYSYAGEHELLVSHCKACLLKFEDSKNSNINDQLGTFYTGLVSGCLHLGRYEESAQYAKKVLADKRTGIVLEAMMHLLLAESYLSLEKIEAAKVEVMNYLQMSQSVNRNDVDVMRQMAVFLSGEAFSENNLEVAYAVLICCELKNGNIKALLENYNKLGWSQPAVYTMEGIEKHFVCAMWTLPFDIIFVHVLMDVLSKGNLREAFRREILSREEQELTDFQETLYLLMEAMQRIIDGPQSGNVLAYFECLQRYVQATCVWCDFLEAQGVLVFSGEKLSCYVQAALNISDYFELEAQDTVSALRKLKDAVVMLPEFAEGIGAFINNYSDLAAQRIEKQKKEMDALRIQVIGQAKAMLASGQTEAALQIIGQLKQMFPEDLGVAELALEVRLNM